MTGRFDPDADDQTLLSLKVQLFRCQRRIWGPTPHGSSNLPFSIWDVACFVSTKAEFDSLVGLQIISRAPDVQHRLLILACSVRLTGGGPISRGRWTGPVIPNHRTASSNLARESKNSRSGPIWQRHLPQKEHTVSVRIRGAAPSFFS